MVVAEKNPENGGRYRGSIIPGNGGSYRGPNTVDLHGLGYSADEYYKLSYIPRRVELAQKGIDLVIRSGLWSEEVARRIVMGGLEKSNPKNTSWIGFRRLGAPIGEYMGFSWQEELRISTVEGDKRLLYLKLRAFEPEAQRKHLGTTAIQLALGIHHEVDYIAHRSGSPAAVYSFLQSGVFREGGRFPYDIPFDKAPILPQILLWLYTLYHVNGRQPHPSTGVSIADYPEPNRAYVPDPTHGPTMKIQQWMEGKLRMSLQRGDALYEVGERG